MTNAGDPSPTDSLPVRLDIGAAVELADGATATLVAVVVEPVSRQLTHLAVEPAHRHQPARLVPIGLLTATADGGAGIALGEQGLRTLERFNLVEYVPIGEAVDVGDGFQVAREHVSAKPYWLAEFVTGALAPTDVQVNVERVPTGECEIRRHSYAVDHFGQTVGYVEGLLVDGTAVTSVLVRTDAPGRKHLVAVPIGVVERVSNEQILMSIGAQEFAKLPHADGDDHQPGSTIRFHDPA